MVHLMACLPPLLALSFTYPKKKPFSCPYLRAFGPHNWLFRPPVPHDGRKRCTSMPCSVAVPGHGHILPRGKMPNCAPLPLSLLHQSESVPFCSWDPTPSYYCACPSITAQNWIHKVGFMTDLEVHSDMVGASCCVFSFKPVSLR